MSPPRYQAESPSHDLLLSTAERQVMNGSTSMHASRQTPIHHVNGQSIGRINGRPSAEHRTSLMSNGHGNGNGPPPGLAPRMTGSPRPRGRVSAGMGAAGNAPFEGPRSPPSTKSEDHKYTSNMITESLMSNPKADTSHVPCKFFRQGACQAGKACPFSHDLDATTVTTPCKYFAKVRSLQIVLISKHND